MISRRTAACQYGSRAEFAIMLARQAGPKEMSSPADVDSVLWQAMQLLERSNRPAGGATCEIPCEPSTCVASAFRCKDALPTHSTQPAATQAMVRFAIALPLPAIEEPAVPPVPQEIGDEPFAAAAPVVDRELHAGVEHDVLPGVERDLHLGHQVPVHLAAGGHVPRAEQFDHR